MTLLDYYDYLRREGDGFDLFSDSLLKEYKDTWYEEIHECIDLIQKGLDIIKRINDEQYKRLGERF